MKNKLTDLNDHLFTQLERLCDETMSTEQIDREIKRTDAIVQVSEQIVSNAALQLRAVEVVAKYGDRHRSSLPMIGSPASSGARDE